MFRVSIEGVWFPKSWVIILPKWVRGGEGMSVFWKEYLSTCFVTIMES